MKKLLLLFSVVLIANTTIVAQETESPESQDLSFKKKFIGANSYMEDYLYKLAAPVWEELLREQPDNYNINFKLGVSYLNYPSNKKKALPYLKKAVQNITGNYDPFSYLEKKAPVEAEFMLGRAYHLAYELDSAIARYNHFKENVTPKHYLYSQVDRNIKQCENAKLAMQNPRNIVTNNLGSRINGPYSDFSPVLSLDETTLYFTSRRIRGDSSNNFQTDESDGAYFEDIYVSHKDKENVWSEPELININTDGHEATINLSIDGLTLFVYKDDKGNGNLYTTNLEDDEWTELKSLGADINLESHETHVHISPDGDILYFVSDRKENHFGSFGGKDIYMCKKLPNGEWAMAQNLGATINTKFNEDGVFIHPDGKTMYFSSEGHDGIGGYDIYSTQMNDDGTWSKPENIGYPINTTDDDVFFMTSADGKRAYYSSFQEKGFGEKDIYMISLQDAEDVPLTLLKGYMEVVGQDHLPEDAQVTVTDNKTGELVGIYKPRYRDGRFTVILEPDNDYHINYSADKYSQDEDLFVPNKSAYQEIQRYIQLRDVVFGDSLKSNINTDVTPNDTKTSPAADNTTSKIIADNSTTSPKEESPAESPVKTATDTPKEDVMKKDPVLDQANPIIASYKEFFNYNIKNINVKDPSFIQFMKKANELVQKNGRLILEIQASASRVPTKTFKNNIELAEKRADDARKLVIETLISKGFKAKDIIVNNIESSVNGPKYAGDFKKTEKYAPFQYVTLNVR